jgi:hypothetical protein
MISRSDRIIWWIYKTRWWLIALLILVVIATNWVYYGWLLPWIVRG